MPRNFIAIFDDFANLILKMLLFSWVAQVLHGGNFGPIIHRKFQMYGVVMFFIFLAGPSVQVNARTCSNLLVNYV